MFSLTEPEQAMELSGLKNLSSISASIRDHAFKTVMGSSIYS